MKIRCFDLCKRTALSLLIAITMVVTFMPAAAFSQGEQQHIGVEISNLKADKQEITGIDETATISFHVKVPDDTTIAEITCYFISDKGDEDGNIMNAVYEGNTTETDYSITKKFLSYGTWGLKYIDVSLTDGRKVLFTEDETAEEDYGDTYCDIVVTNLSACNVCVKANPSETDNDAPVISGPYNTEPKNVPKKDKPTISFKIQEKSALRSVLVTLYRKDAPMTCGNDVPLDPDLFGDLAGYIDENGTFIFKWDSLDAGDYQIKSIEVQDVFLNKSIVFNENCEDNEYETGNKADMSAADFTVEAGEQSDDKDAPVIDEETISIAEKKLQYNESNMISCKVTDDHEILNVSIGYYSDANKSTFYSAFGEYNKENGLYEFRMPEHKYFGDWRVREIRAEDEYNNVVILSDKNAFRRGECIEDDGTYIWTDLSDLVYMCGIKDSQTDVYVSGNGMVESEDNPLKLDVDPIDNGEAGYNGLMDTLHDENFEDGVLYEIDMEGEYDSEGEGVNVLLPEKEGYNEGDIVQITHLVDAETGEVQKKLTKIKNGSAQIKVEGFSPFLIEKAKDAEDFADMAIDPDPVKFVPAEDTDHQRTWDDGLSFIPGDKVKVFDETSNSYKIYEYTGGNKPGFYCNGKKLEKKIAADPDTSGLDEYTVGAEVDVNVYCNDYLIPCEGSFKYALSEKDCWMEIDTLSDGIYYCLRDYGDTEATVVGFDGSITEAVIKETIDIDGNEYPVTKIADGALVNSGLSRITIPSSVTSIGEYAIGYNETEEGETYVISKVEGFVIKGEADSAASRYAEDNGIAFEEVTCVHSLTEHAAEEAGCTHAGNTAYWSCGKCGKFFSDADGKAEIEENSWVIQASGHKWGKWIESNPSSCIKKGQMERVCENDPGHKEYKDAELLRHNLVKTSGAAATYDREGNIEYWTCTECGKIFRDAAGTHEIRKADTVMAKLIPKKGASVDLTSGTYKVTGASTVSFAKPVNAKSVIVPDTVIVGGKKYAVTVIETNAFKNSKAATAVIGKNVRTIKPNALKGSRIKTLTIKTKMLTKKSVKNSLKGSKVKTIKVKVGTKKQNKTYVKKYKGFFTKKNAGKKVTVK